jgi:hypothetical protein
MNRDEARELKVFQTDLDMKDGEFFHLRFGPLDYYLEKIETEIRVRWMTSNDWMDSSFHYQYPFTGMYPGNLLTEKRFALSSRSPQLKVSPCLGEMPFVVKPDTTFFILPGETAKIYLSTPMSVRLTDNECGIVIDEIPVLHRVKTWFGETPTKGQLCFFTRIHAALLEENLPFRPHRALTHLYIMNSSKTPLPIEKLKIPVNHLKLYQDNRGLFVTSSLSLRIDNRENLKDLKIFAPSEGNTNLDVIHEPREKIPKGFFKSTTEIMR